MGKMTKAAAMDLMDSWEAVQKKIARAEKARNAELEPLIERHNEELKPILEKHDVKIGKLTDQAASLENQVVGYLEAQNKDQVISTGGAVAEQKTETKIGARVIDPKRFYDLVKSKGSEFWGCLKVEIAKAERFLGKTQVDEIADKKETTVVSRTLRLK